MGGGGQIYNSIRQIKQLKKNLKKDHWRDMAQCLENCGQFIGLKDKNGKDIYEGDIIKTINNNFGVIVKKDHCFEVTVSENQSSLYRADWIEQSEILGNIFDNPNLISELLKSEGEK